MRVLDVGGIHQYLEFEGKVMLSSIMPDELLVREDVFENFLHFFDAAGFDMAIAWDVPVYIDIPLHDSWVNLLMGAETRTQAC